MTPRRKRFAIALGILAVVGAVTALVLNAFQSNLVFFYTPSQIAASEAPTGRTFRLGGLVLAGSVQREGVLVRFTVTDTCLLYTSPSPRDRTRSRMPSSA